MQCIHCQQQHPMHHTYCPTTGKSIDGSITEKHTFQSQEFCVDCGTKNKSGYLKCTSCGRSVVQLTTKKMTFDQVIDQGIQTISSIKGSKAASSVSEQLKKENLKLTFAGHFAYLKRTPLIVLPVLISMVLVILLAVLTVNGVRDNAETIADFTDEEIMYLLDTDVLAAQLEEQYGVEADIPKFPMLAFVLVLMHNVDFSLSGNALSYDGTEKMAFEMSNFMYGLLLFPVIALAIGAIVYGILARKNGWKFWAGIGYSTILYTVFLLIVTILSGYSVKLRMEVAGDIAQLSMKFTPSIFNGIVSAILISTVIFTFFGYIAYHGKNTLVHLNNEIKYFKYAMYALGATAVGLVVNYVLAIFALKGAVKEMGAGLLNELAIVPDSLFYLFAVYVGTLNWFMSLFGKVQFAFSEYGDRPEKETFSWFFNSEADSIFMSEVQEATTAISPMVLVIFTVAALAGIGYLLSKMGVLPLQEIAFMALAFTIVQCLLMYFANMSYSLKADGDQSLLTINYTFFNLAISSFVVAFGSVYAGGFLRTKLGK